MVKDKFRSIRNKFEREYREDGLCWSDFNMALDSAYKLAIKNLLLSVKNGELGEVDYEFDGNKVIKDNIILKKKELLQKYNINGG